MSTDGVGRGGARSSICRRASCSDHCNVPADPSASAAPVVVLKRVGKTFANGVIALERLDLDVRPGEFVSLLGPSGCGKSTALRIVAGLSAPPNGTVEAEAANDADPRRIG